MRTTKTIPTIIGVSILVIGLAIGVFFVQRQQLFRLGASPQKTPGGVKITNVSDVSFTVSWVTDNNYAGYVEWGESPSLGQIAQPVSQELSQRHLVRVTDLSPGKKYYFKINSGGELFDNNGEPWDITTLSAPYNSSKIISGKILLASGVNGSGILVYATLDSSEFSALSDSEGKFLITISGNNLDDNAEVDIFVQGGAEGIASAKGLLGSMNPMPNITLGQVYDFTSIESVENSESPSSSISLPESTSGVETSKLGEASQQGGDEVTLESVESGESVSSDQEFFGTGPSGVTLTIVVESDPITGSATVDSDGVWDWAPPDGLPPGEHTITITWKDASGILHSITRSFEVLAAGDEAVSTPSPSPTSSPTPSPSSTQGATPAPVPVTGFGLPTLIFVTFAIFLLCGSVVMFFMSEN